MRRLEFEARAFELLLNMCRALHRGLFGFPDLLEIRELLFESGELVRDVFEPLHRRVVGFFLERLAFDLELNNATLELVHFLGLRVDLDADTRSRLVDQIDRLIRQLAITDVAMRKRCRSDNCRIRNFNAVVNLIAFLEATQNRYRVFDSRLFNEHLLEAAFQSGVFLKVLAVLVQRRRAHAVKFATRESWLKHIAGIHRPFGFTGTHHRVQFVDEQDDLAFLFREIVEHTFEALFELTAELGASDQGAHVERENTFATQPFWNFIVNDALGETFENSRLTHTGFADEHGIVLGAPLQDLDRTANFVVATDNRIKLALLRTLGQVNREFLERLA